MDARKSSIVGHTLCERELRGLYCSWSLGYISWRYHTVWLDSVSMKVIIAVAATILWINVVPSDSNSYVYGMINSRN